jgi:hypothetical protein
MNSTEEIITFKDQWINEDDYDLQELAVAQAIFNQDDDKIYSGIAWRINSDKENCIKYCVLLLSE